MAKYESKIKQINAPVESVYATLSNLENFRPMLENAQSNETLKDKIREAGQDPTQLDKLKDVKLTADSIAIPAPMVGEIVLAITERDENKCIKLHTEKSPVDAFYGFKCCP